MKKKKENEEMLDEYDFSQGEKGKYFKEYKEGSNVVVLDPKILMMDCFHRYDIKFD